MRPIPLVAVPAWLEADADKLTAKVIALPERDQIMVPVEEASYRRVVLEIMPLKLKRLVFEQYSLSAALPRFVKRRVLNESGIEKPKIETEGITPDGTYGKFIVEPLERGYGTTLGNSLRRVLLSSLPGYAIISVKIDGILHEFSTIPGVKEDVTEIVLNLKDVILKIHGDGPKTVYIDASGECGDHRRQHSDGF